MVQYKLTLKMERQYDVYEILAIGSAINHIKEYVTMKTLLPVKGLCKLIGVGRREKLCIMYKRADDTYFLELSITECKKIIKNENN